MLFRSREDLLPGRVTRISADALSEPRNGTPYFAVQVAVPPAQTGAVHAPLLPGQSAEVYVRTSERTPLDFLLEPLLAGMRRSFREH